MFLDIFFPQLKIYLLQQHTSLTDYLGNIHHSAFSVTAIIFIGLSCLFVLRKLMQVLFSLYALRSLVKRATQCYRPIENAALAMMLCKYKINIYLSDEIHIPLATYPRMILLPKKTLKILTQQEFEAVIAHEAEHLKSQDPFARLFYHCTAAVFWWVPTQTWIKKIEQDQEMACDAVVFKYGLKKESIASALVKVAKQQAKTPQAMWCYFNTPTHPTIARMQTILGLCSLNEEKILGLNFSIVALEIAFLLVCFIWP